LSGGLFSLLLLDLSLLIGIHLLLSFFPSSFCLLKEFALLLDHITDLIALVIKIVNLSLELILLTLHDLDFLGSVVENLGDLGLGDIKLIDNLLLVFDFIIGFILISLSPLKLFIEGFLELVLFISEVLLDLIHLSDLIIFSLGLLCFSFGNFLLVEVQLFV